MAEKEKASSLFVVHQALQGTGTAGIYGTYRDRESAQNAIEQVKGGGGLTAHREATYYIQEVSVQEFGSPPAKTSGPPPGAVGAASPVQGLTVSESGEALNAPNKQLPDDEDDPHTRNLRKSKR